MTRPHSLYLIGCLALGLLMTACKPQAMIAKRVKADSFAEEKLDFDYLKAKAKVQYKAGDSQSKFTADIRIVNDSAVWMSFRAAGIEGIRILAMQDSVFGMNRLEKSHYALAYDDLSELLGFSIDYDLLQSMILGELPESYKIKGRARVDDEHFVLRNSKGGIRSRAYINRTSLKLNRIWIEERKSKTGLSVGYDGFVAVPPKEAQYLPADCEIVIGDESNEEIVQERGRLHVHYNKLRLEDNPVKLIFKIPSKFKLADIGDLLAPASKPADH